MLHDPSRKFVFGFCGVLLCGLLAVLSVNVIVDPFQRFDLVTIQGINAQRPVLSSNARMAKAGAVCRIRPQSVIMGSSRAEVGLDPKHPGFGDGRTFNLAISAMGIGEMALTLRHAVHASPSLKQAVIALDFLMFNAHREAVVFQTEILDFEEGRLLLSPNDTCTSRLLKDADRLIGFGGLKFVDETIWGQRHESERALIDSYEQASWWMALYDRLGFRGDNYEVVISLAERTGKRIFSEGDGAGQEIYYTNKIWRAGPQHRYCFAKTGQPNTINEFREMIRFARRSGLDVRIVINPVHARMLMAIQEIGLWPQYEEWKRLLVKTLAQEAAESGSGPYPLWDFSGFNSITMEDSPPAQNVHKIARWFWEPSHYRKETGNLMLDRVLGYRTPERLPSDDFGTLLNASNIEGWLAHTRDAGRHYAAIHPADVANLRERLAPLFGDWTGVNCGDDIQAVNDAAVAIRKGDNTSADELFARALAIRSRDRRQATELGVPYREPDLEPVIVAARQGIGVDPPLDNWQAYQDRANYRLAQGDVKGALKDYSLAIKESPPNPALHFLRGQACMQAKDFLAAIQEFDAGLKIAPSNVALYFLRGNAKLLLEDFNGAANDFQAGLRLDPNNAPLRSLLGKARSWEPRPTGRTTKGADAKDYADTLSWQAYQERGNARAAAGELRGAIEDYTSALRSSPPNPALYFLRGRVKLQMKDDVGAALDFEAGLKLDPNNKPLKDLLLQAREESSSPKASPASL